MLILSRRCQESVVVGGPGGAVDTLKVTVLSVGGGGVRLGFEAQADIRIHRWEVWQRLRTGGPPDSPTKDAAVSVV